MDGSKIRYNTAKRDSEEDRQTVQKDTKKYEQADK